jgi:hypothetical protein
MDGAVAMVKTKTNDACMQLLEHPMLSPNPKTTRLELSKIHPVLKIIKITTKSHAKN